MNRNSTLESSNFPLRAAADMEDSRLSQMSSDDKIMELMSKPVEELQLMLESSGKATSHLRRSFFEYRKRMDPFHLEEKCSDLSSPAMMDAQHHWQIEGIFYCRSRPSHLSAVNL